jgi:hypothetical protein
MGITTTKWTKRDWNRAKVQSQLHRLGSVAPSRTGHTTWCGRTNQNPLLGSMRAPIPQVSLGWTRSIDFKSIWSKG